MDFGEEDEQKSQPVNAHPALLAAGETAWLLPRQSAIFLD